LGGRFNVSSGCYSKIGGGCCNTSSGSYSSLGGGFKNTAQAFHGFIGGGNCNQICHSTSGCCAIGATVAGGVGNNTCGGTWTLSSCAFTSTPPTVCNSGPFSFIGGGFQNRASACFTTIGGGDKNTASGTYSTVGGGDTNIASGNYSFIGGGLSNVACGLYATLSGGLSNKACGTYSTVSGGYCNTASGSYSAAGGCNVNNSCPLTFMYNCLRACNLIGTSVNLCVGTDGIIVRGATSDGRLKTCISPITYGLSDVLQLNPVSFNWCENLRQSKGEEKQLGFIAQEVEPIIPESVGMSAEGEYSLSLEKIIPVLTKAIQELKEEIDKIKLKLEM
jgi:hypothetical protein